MKLKLHESKLDRELELRKAEPDEGSPLRDIDSNHIISMLEDNMRTRETPILERIKAKLKK